MATTIAVIACMIMTDRMRQAGAKAGSGPRSDAAGARGGHAHPAWQRHVRRGDVSKSKQLCLMEGDKNRS